MSERIDVTITVNGSDRVVREFDRVSKKALEANRSVEFLKRALLTFSAGYVVREVTRLVDSYTTLSNKLRILTGETAGLGKVTDDLFTIANKTRAPISGIVSLYQKGSLASKELGASQEDLLKFVESVGLALGIQGQAGQGVEGAILQLSQALGSSVFRAEEFNSVMESAFPIALAAAKGIDEAGGSVARLRLLVLEGKISSEEFFRSLIKQNAELSTTFDRTQSTIAGAFTVLRNNLIRFTGELATRTGVAAAYANIILLLANNLDLVARVLGALSFTALSVGLVRVTQDFGRFLVATAKSPFLAIALSLTTVVGLLITFGDLIRIGSGNLATLQDLAIATWQSMVDNLNVVVQTFSSGFGVIKSLVQPTFGAINISIAGILSTTAFVVDAVAGLFVGLYRGIVAVFKNLAADLGDLIVSAFNKVTDLIEKSLNAIIKLANKVSPLKSRVIGKVELARLQNDAKSNGLSIGESFQAGLKDGLSDTTLQDAFSDVVDKANQRAKERAAGVEAAAAAVAAGAGAGAGVGGAGVGIGAGVGGAVSPGLGGGGASLGGAVGPNFSTILKDLELEGQLLQLTNEEREVRRALLDAEDQLQRKLTVSEESQIDAVVRLNQNLRDQAQVFDSITGPSDDYSRSIAALDGLLAKGRITLDQYNEKLKETRITYLDTQRDLESGAENAFLKIARDAADSAAQIQQVLTNSFNRAEDVFVNFVKTGRLSFASLVDSIQEDIARIAFRQLITAPLASSLGGFTGAGGGGAGFFSGLSSLFGFANGGEFRVGGQGGTDSQLVAFRASPNETVRVTRPDQKISSGGDTVIINIQTQDAASFQRSDNQVLSDFAAKVARIKKRNT